MTEAPRKFEEWVYSDPTSKTGLRWLPGQKWREAYSEAGCINPRTGYATLTVKENGKDVRFLCHRIVYYLEKGVWPDKNRINHKNRIRSDNSISNLEYIEGSEKQVESIQKIDRGNRGDLPRYVSWNKRDKRYQGSIRLDSKRKSLGYSQCVNTLHKKAIDIINTEYNRNFEYTFVQSCNFCVRCPHTACSEQEE
jgi:hypothetical protein